MPNSSSTSKPQKRQEPLVYANPFCHPETFLAAWSFLFFLLSLTAATIPPTTAVWLSPVIHSPVCPSPFFLLVFAATSHCPEGKHASHQLNRYGEEIRRSDLTFQPLYGRIREEATDHNDTQHNYNFYRFYYLFFPSLFTNSLHRIFQFHPKGQSK